MEKYWKAHPTTPSSAPGGPDNLVQPSHKSLLSEFDRHRLALLSSQDEVEGWESEMRRYLKNMPADVTKDTDIVKWWEVCMSIV
jgi:hypothetical protein